MQPTQLELVYREATGSPGLIEFVDDLRASDAKYKKKKDAVYQLFKGMPLWEEKKTASGHVKFKHKLSHISIGYSNHGDGELDPGAAITIRDRVQDHLNLFGNEIFAWKRGNWKSEPDYAKAEKRFAQWQKRAEDLDKA